MALVSRIKELPPNAVVAGGNDVTNQAYAVRMVDLVDAIIELIDGGEVPGTVIGP